MRIVIDMQGWQAASRNRGIGRYTLSLVKEILRVKGEHEYILVFNGCFENSVVEFKKELIRDEIGNDNYKIKVWYPTAPTRYVNSENRDNQKNSEIIFNSFISALKPDFLLLTSIFEGLIDESLSSLTGHESFNTGVILYDLIPLLYPDIYLSNNVLKSWYNEKLGNLKKADFLFSISESAGREAISELKWDEEKVVNISTAADSKFKPQDVSAELKSKMKSQFNINDNFLMYTGGWDYRKNIERLIKSYSLLSEQLRSEHQLVIVCSIPEENKTQLKNLAKSCGIEENQLILTGYVSDELLVAMYNLCHAFVFPSWHEGFGLPVLEAMLCGKAVIASNLSSLPEVLNYPEAQFDPYDENDIKDKMEKVLSDIYFRERVIEHCSTQVKAFTWEKSALLLIDGIENKLINKNKKTLESDYQGRKKKLAFFSPLPPEKSGISYYSEDLLPYLSKYYEVEVINNDPAVLERGSIEGCIIRKTEDFISSFSKYDRVLYQVGNSHFHSEMFEMIKSHPGVTVLHDFYLSGVLNWISNNGDSCKAKFFNDHLYESHGYQAVVFNNNNVSNDDAIKLYPCNYPILENSKAVIFHSNYSLNLSCEWYRGFNSSKLSYVPLLRIPEEVKDRSSARLELGINDSDIVIISLGYIAPTKLNHRLIDAFDEIRVKGYNIKLVFVGHNPSDHYGKELSSMIEKSKAKDRISITGWVDDVKYKTWLAAADIGVQLRTMSRGETSAAVLDCMNYGLATIANANGSLSELDPDAVKLLDDDFTDSDLTKAILDFVESDQVRNVYRTKAKALVKTNHAPEYCAEKYYEVIERAYSSHSFVDLVIEAVDGAETLSELNLDIFSQAVADTSSLECGHKIFLDITRYLSNPDNQFIDGLIRDFIAHSSKDLHLIPVHYDGLSKRLISSQLFLNNILPLNEMNVSDDIVDTISRGRVIKINPTMDDFFASMNYYEYCSLSNRVTLLFTESEFENLADETKINEDYRNRIRDFLNFVGDIVIINSIDSTGSVMDNVDLGTYPSKNISFISVNDLMNALQTTQNFNP